MKICIITTVLAVGFPVVANADQGANGCTAALSPGGPMICSNTAPTITPTTDITEFIAATARPEVINGTLFRDAARHAAEAAGQCPEPLK